MLVIRVKLITLFFAGFHISIRKRKQSKAGGKNKKKSDIFFTDRGEQGGGWGRDNNYDKQHREEEYGWCIYGEAVN